MSERDGYRHGVPCWVDTWRLDPAAAVGFYAALFGWEVDGERPHFMCRKEGADVAGIGTRVDPPPPDWNTYIWVDDVDATAAASQAAGGTIVTEPFDSLDGGRMAVLADPEGATFGVWAPGAHKG